MRRVLFLGFSCTALTFSYATVLRKRLRAQGDEVTLCGLGGLTPHIIPIAFDRMHALKGPFTHVVLEIGTSGYAINTMDTLEVARDLALDCLHRVAATGARPAVLLLYRDDLRDLRVPWSSLLREAAGHFDYPVVDLAEGLVGAHGEDFARSLLVDDVHPTPNACRFQADRILDALGDWLDAAAAPAVPTPPAWVRRAWSLAEQGEEVGTFKRQDYRFPFARLAEGETLTVDFPEPLRATGLSFVMGPHGGDLEVSTNDGDTFVAAGFDGHSYYERLGMRAFGHPVLGRSVSRLSVRQRPGMPDVRLLKGEPSPGPREGRLVDLLYFGRS